MGKNTVIKVSNLSKRYMIGESAGSLREQLTYFARRLFGRSKTSKSKDNIIWALKDINLEVEQGEVLGIIGHNGAGKSTLLKLLSRITHPTTGRIEMHGRVASLLEVGTGFHPELTGRENIYMNAAILGMRRAETRKRFDEIVAFAEVEQFIDTPVKRYSSGMYTRLAFAVAAHLEPEILIVDEVLSVGDMAFQKKSLGKMEDVSQQGRTVLFVSHNVGAVSSLCTRAIHLKNGVVQKIGKTSEVVSDYIGFGLDKDGGQRIWKPGEAANNRIQLLGIRVINDDQITSDVDIGKDIIVEVDYEVLEEGVQAYVSLQLFDKVGIGVLATANIPSANLIIDDLAGKSLTLGVYRSRCVIPANTLNDTLYRLTVVLLTNVSRIDVMEDNAIAFTGHDSGSMRKEFTGNWLGVVRPRLAWQTQTLTKAEHQDVSL